MPVAAEGGCGEWAVYIQVYELERFRSVLDLNSNELLLLLGFDAMRAHGVITREFGSERSYGNRVHVSEVAMPSSCL